MKIWKSRSAKDSRGNYTMKLEVPFYAQTTPFDCGPTVLRMVVEFLAGKPLDYTKISQLVELEKKGVTFTIGLAKAAAELGFKTEFYTKSLVQNPDVWNLEFAKQHTNGFEESNKKIKRLITEAKKFGAVVAEKTFELPELLAKTTPSSIPIVLLDWSKITGKGQYAGHFVPLVGFDEQNVYVHTEYNVGTKENRIIKSRPFFAIPHQTFDSARKSFGTDEDLIVINKKWFKESM
jgi:uncharacterized protein YvpB